MITSKELDYVNTWARKIPMPGVEYSINTLEELKRCIDLYATQYQGKEYEIIFSDNNEVRFKIDEKNLCHLLGIDYQGIRDSVNSTVRTEILGISEESFSSFELLNQIATRATEIAESDNDMRYNYKLLNYYKIRIKCEIFKKFTDFSRFNFAALAKENQIDLFIPSNEAVCPYFSLGLCQDDNWGNEPYYFAKTSIAVKDVNRFFTQGEVVLPTQILNYNGDVFSKIQATPEEKLRLIDMYKSLIFQYGIENKLNIFGDYEALLAASMDVSPERIRSRS